VTREAAPRFFELDAASPYMLFTTRVRDEVRETLPAVTHVDQSARVQTVDAATSPRFHAVLDAFGELTGVPVLLNTSFNVRGEPIVCSPDDAYRCFMRTAIDVLVMESFLLLKDDQVGDHARPHPQCVGA
jgi:carbamoyltransferase